MASNEHVAVSAVTNQANSVNIRVIALAHATNENEDLHLVVDLDSNISQLKERLTQSLSNHPQADAQRLIYQGRALTDGNATLRTILRLEPMNTNNPPVHVIHLVVRETPPGIPSSTNRSQPIQAPIPTPTANDNAEPQPDAPIPPGLGFAPQAFPPGHPAGAALQDIIQQHMANAAALLNQHQQIHQNQQQQHQTQHHLQPQPHQNPHQNLHPNPHQHIHPTPHQHLHQNPHQQHHLPNGLPAPFPMPGLNLRPFPGRHATPSPGPPQSEQQRTNGVSATPATNIRPVSDHAENPPNIPQSSFTMSVQETIGPNGERTRRVVHSGPGLPAHLNPVERPAPAPSANAPITLPGLPPRPSMMPLSQTPTLPPFLPPAMGNLHHSFGRLPVSPSVAQQIPAAPVRNAVVYLVSSPSGPEALLFTPDHGYFTSQQSPPTAQTSHHSHPQVPGSAGPPLQPTPTQSTPQASSGPRNNDHVPVALRPQAPAPAAAAAAAAPPAPAPPAPAPGPVQPQPGRREGEDLVALVLQRGWLFLRLYMFIFVLSEPGTWRRYILLTVASLVCLLPRNNPVTDLLQVGRRHFDNLIGPPQPPVRPQRPQANDHQAGRTPAQGNTEDGAALNPRISTQRDRTSTDVGTPEQNARRLLREHEQRHPNVVRDTLYRIEQGVVLFLASLIPGVGERHVRAREEARRIEQEEAERAARETEARAQQNPRADDHKLDDTLKKPSDPAVSDVTSTATVSTGVDATGSSTAASTSGSSEGLRLRDTGASSSESST